MKTMVFFAQINDHTSDYDRRKCVLPCVCIQTKTNDTSDIAVVILVLSSHELFQMTPVWTTGTCLDPTLPPTKPREQRLNTCNLS